jgi:hypothetical protein
LIPATDSETKRPPIPVKSATPFSKGFGKAEKKIAALDNKGHKGLQKGGQYGKRKVIHAKDRRGTAVKSGGEIIVSGHSAQLQAGAEYGGGISNPSTGGQGELAVA